MQIRRAAARYGRDRRAVAGVRPAGSCGDIHFTGSAVRTAQQWLFDPLGNGNYNIINEQKLNCMRTLASADFAAVETIDCTTISGEIWSINMVDGAPTSIFRCAANLSRNQFNGSQLFSLSEKSSLSPGQSAGR